MIRKISAHYIFTVNAPPIKFGTVIIDETGTILEIIDPKGDFGETEKTEFFNGVITPGFINPFAYPNIIEKLTKAEKIKRISTSESLLEANATNASAPLILSPTQILIGKSYFPNPMALEETGCLITLGSDSPITNPATYQLIEMKSVLSQFAVPFSKLLQWITLNCSIMLDIEKTTGSLVPGKRPGLNLIGGFNFETMNLSESSTVKILVQ